MHVFMISVKASYDSIINQTTCLIAAFKSRGAYHHAICITNAASLNFHMRQCGIELALADPSVTPYSYLDTTCHTNLGPTRLPSHLSIPVNKVVDTR